MSLLKHLHKLQEEEFERYNYYKEKYTKELVNENMPDYRKENYWKALISWQETMAFRTMRN